MSVIRLFDMRMNNKKPFKLNSIEFKIRDKKGEKRKRGEKAFIQIPQKSNSMLHSRISWRTA